MAFIGPAIEQELLQATEPGTDYESLKEWAINRHLVFQDFSKDSLYIVGGKFQEKEDLISYDIEIFARFCGGHDYSGLAYKTVMAQYARTDVNDFLSQIFQKQRQYVEALAGTPSQDSSFAGKYTLRESRDQGGVGVAYGQGGWELGMFLRAPYLGIHVTRSKDDLCK